MSHDIVIAGGGPNGLLLACELSLAGVRPLVLERLPQPTTENRANGLVGQVVRLLDHRGLHEELSGNPEPPRPVPQYVFGAFPLPLADLPANPMCVLGVPQTRVEEVLGRRAIELGVRILRGHELTGLTQDSDGVDVDVEGPDGPYRLRTRYLIGADGGRSRTRKLAGIEFPGVTRDDTVSRAAHVRVPAELIDPATGGLTVPGHGVIPPFQHYRTEHGMMAYAPFPDRPTLLSTMEWGPVVDPDAPMTLTELQESVSRVLGTGIALRAPEGPGSHLVRRRVGGNSRLAQRYRQDRVLLVGDAAHVHSAIGGPGLNLGMQDAVNLGWKLAAVVRGTAPEGLLDTYDTERRQASERVLMHTQAQSALVQPGPAVTALRALFGEFLAEPENRSRIANMMAGTDIRYDMATGPHPLTGYFLPDVPLCTEEGDIRLAELARTGRPLLLDLAGDPAIADIAAGWRDRADLITAKADVPAAAVLIRPDGYVAWAADTSRPDELRAALTRWFGAEE
ncbi:FAD-dependent oxidoreductase [Pseudonocardiaceae bacterium YIM PH 21723]|nr:FAD-dependent oxidoreductase [Pseudonocardiaceae bacterium YIM PH 21723]